MGGWKKCISLWKAEEGKKRRSKSKGHEKERYLALGHFFQYSAGRKEIGKEFEDGGRE